MNLVRPQPKSISGLFSAIVPAYNAALCLGRCIESILAQTYQPIEIIIINDGSTDATEEVAKHFGDKVRYTYQQNQGETAARNTGIAMAGGEYIAFLDHDDYWKPQFAQRCIEFLQAHPQAQAVSVCSEHTSAVCGRSLMPASFANPPQDWDKPFIIEQFFDFWAQHNHVCAGSITFRRNLIVKAGGQRTDLILSGDLEYWGYLATFGKWGFIPEILTVIDGTQALRSGDLYTKYYNRYRRAPSTENWEERITSRLQPDDHDGFSRVRGQVTVWFIFARIYVGEDKEALRMARKYRQYLPGKFGRLWSIGAACGMLTWKPLCMLMRQRIRIQYAKANGEGRA